MRDEPTHLRTLLALGSHHLKIEVLRELCELVGSGLSRINSNDAHGGFRLAGTAPRPPDLGQHEYSPWEVADLVMHGAVFHRKDRFKRELLASLDEGSRAMLDLSFRL